MDRVFGAGRLQMATGAHVEVIREAVEHGVERRYTKRFLAGPSGDLHAWTEREWRILQRLARHRAPVAKPLELLPADASGAVRLQTRDAGATVEQWATLVPLRRGDRALRSAFEDRAHWWALARHCLLALDAVHALGFVHLEFKPDNVCIPWAPAGAGRPLPGQPLRPRFKGLALIDVAFSILPEVDDAMPLPLLRQPAYEYQSPRLLHALEEGRRGQLGPTRALDWRCDFFSLAGMLWHYLPELDDLPGSGWSTTHHLAASEFVQHLLDLHGAAMPADWPHYDLIAVATERLREPELAAALDASTSFDPERRLPLATAATPPTRLAFTPPPPPKAAPAPLQAAGAAPTGVASAPAASAPTPLAGPESDRDRASGSASTTASAPAPLAGPPAPQPTAGEPARREPTAGEPAQPEPAAHEAPGPDAKAAARPPSRADRAAARLRLAKRVATGAAVVAAVAFGWWFGGEQEPRFEMPSLSDVARHPLPASSMPQPQPRLQPQTAVADRAAAASSSLSTPAPIPTPTPPQAEATPPVNDELVARAETWRREQLPAVAVAAERHLARVLAVAAGSAEFRRRSSVRAAARAMRAATPPPSVAADGEQARSLNDAALVSYGKSSDVDEAIVLQTQAFGANPFDSEVAGNLAFLYLKERPPQAEAARRLALHALTLNDVRFPRGRIEDWTTLAIASALTGHDVDARNAWYVALALTGDLQHLCDSAVRAEASHGERVRPSVQALLQRARSSAAYGRCEIAAAPKESRTKPQAKPVQRPRRTIP